MNTGVRERTNMIQITKTVKWARLMTIIGMTLLSLVVIYWVFLLLTMSTQLDMMIEDAVISDQKITLNTTSRIISVLIILTPICMGIYLLHVIRKLFEGYQKGEIFTQSSCKLLERIGWVVAAFAPVYTINDSLLTIVASMFNEPGKRFISISIDETDILAIVIGILIIVVSKVMKQAVMLSEENKSFV